ncbi:MAG: hypothetical protein JWN65_1548 [Solirubrobacterales bacterium]|nr:hypothetical protein [Solirubrobacterales bacterium]
MPKMVSWHRIALAVSLTSLAVPSGALASTPATVDLRIEGPASTLYEGKVTADVRPFQFTGDPATHQCDGTFAGGEGTSPTPVTVRNNALSAAAGPALTFTGTWFSFGASFSSINGVNVDFDAGSGRFLAEYKNGQFASAGGCADPIATGDSVLYAYATGSETLLGLSGPATARPGDTVTLTVSDLGAPATRITGATVAGATSAADGTVTVGPLAGGPTTFKATKAGAIRSNAVTVCASDGADGRCGTTAAATTTPASPPTGCQTTGKDGLCGSPDKTAPVAAIKGLKEQARFRRGHAPLTLSGRVDADPAGLKDVRLRLTRTLGPRCSYYSGTLERFVKTRLCGARGDRFFSIGDRAEWSYLLPLDLPRGRYVLDVQTVDRAGNVSAISARGRDRIVFLVR